MNNSLRSTCTCWWHPRGLNLKDICLIFRKFSELLVKMTTCSKVWRTLSMVTGRFANESVRQRMKSIRQRRSVSSPTPLNNRIRGHFYPYTHINYFSFFYPLSAKRNKPLNMCTQNLTPYNFFYSSFFHPSAIQLIPRSFIHCRAKRTTTY